MRLSEIYGYVPTKWLSVIAIVSFTICEVINLLEIIKHQSRASIAAFIGTIGEIISWIVRLYSSSFSSNDTGFVPEIIQSVLIMDFPVFYTAQMCTALKHLVTQYGAEIGNLGQKLYGLAYITSDVISLFIQFVKVDTTVKENEDGKKERAGSDIILLGICLQLATVLAFAVCSLEYWYHHHHNKLCNNPGYEFS
ncbi:hypothetical protein SJAG_02114 [Schizosaccharomyces japonicus yFS275]|uniref:Sphingoid long-chain base transporter RSB1 n=1 Tax=Schizosaccharomyces japonicus (strain yFS275 / FY16936) TaxID=402676 RepID=B6K1K4_SCHJY|nr:hypothetical protein SJAG_02114 [Schizosaccharomyces japonicus yFS275]EEB07035.1 hypothetical protein SJAG_02114 [Schizosaccharomyces japonicus yFS275]